MPRLAEVLQVDMSWFFKPAAPQTPTSFFRSLKSSLGQLRDKAQARLIFVEAIDAALSEYVDMPEVDIPDLMEGREFSTLRNEDIERIAGELREYWLLGFEPIDDLLVIIENAGVIVAEDEIGSTKLDGVSMWSNDTDRPYMLLAKDKDVGVRRRFDAAHELGHLVLHQEVSPTLLAKHFDLIEEQAMAFAGAFLMPDESFLDDVYSLSLDALVGLKDKWKVSVGAMIKRLSSLDRISPEYERRLWQYYSYRRWRGGEPLDDEIEIEEPQNLKAAIESLVDEGIARKSTLLKEIGLSAGDVTLLTGLPHDYFEPPPGTVVRLQPKLKGEARRSRSPGNVVSLTGKRSGDRE